MAHSYIASYAHFVFSTSNRDPVLPADASKLFEYIGGILRAERCALLAAGGMPDHLHLLIRLNAQSSFAHLMSVVKARSSSWLKESNSGLDRFAWQAGYGAFSVSKSAVDEVTRYISRQADHHRTMSFKDEFIALLERHGVEYDAERVWK
jgi:REP element-mobilizing transposase RayT